MTVLTFTLGLIMVLNLDFTVVYYMVSLKYFLTYFIVQIAHLQKIIWL